MISKPTQQIIIMILLAVFFYVNLPVNDIEILSKINQTRNITYIMVNETIPIYDLEGNIVGNETMEVNKTVFPEQEEMSPGMTNLQYISVALVILIIISFFFQKNLKNKQISMIVLLLLLAFIFYYGTSPFQQISDKKSVANETENIPYNITINKTIPILDLEGNIIKNLTIEVNKTIIPEKELPQKIEDAKQVILNLGKIIWPSNEIGGWIVVLLIGYFVILPILRWIKELMWGSQPP